MSLDVSQLLARRFPVVRHTYTAFDTVRYALSVGLGMAPTDARELRYVHEECEGGLRVMPAMASVLAYAGHWSRDPALGLDWKRILHGEQRMQLHRPLAAAARVVAETRITDIVDKGEGRGALLCATRQILDEDDHAPVATVTMVTFARGDGGRGGSGPGPAPLAALPQRVPDHVVERPTSPQGALLYRLQGDLNPLHADPAVAAQAGYPRPILHGLSFFALATDGVITHACDADPGTVRELSVRFTAPVFPGETLRTEVWREGTQARYRTSVPARGVVVLDRGTVGFG